MTLFTSTKFFHTVYDPLKDHFETNQAQSFHNLMWQLIVNEAHKDKLICLHPVYQGDAGLQLSIVFFNESGHSPTYVKFVKGTTYDQAHFICDKLNGLLFGMLPDLAMVIVARSMRKPDTEAATGYDSIDEIEAMEG